MIIGILILLSRRAFKRKIKQSPGKNSGVVCYTRTYYRDRTVVSFGKGIGSESCERDTNLELQPGFDG